MFKTIRIMIASIARRLAGDARALSPTPSILLLLGVAAAVFAPVIFKVNDVNMSLLGALRSDYASMLDSMLVILEPHHLYTQMAAFHSAVYGWTYFFLSFWFMLPVRIVALVLHADPFMPVYIGLKILHFVYSALAALSFYFLCRRFVSNTGAMIAAVTLMLGTTFFYFSYMFHPETIGALFLNLAMIYLYDHAVENPADEGRRLQNHYIVLLFLVLASLAKPTFFLVAAPLAGLLFATCMRGRPAREVFGARFLALFAGSAAVAMIVFFIVNPSVFYFAKAAWKVQVENMQSQSFSSLALPGRWAAFRAWLIVEIMYPVLLFCIAGTLACLAGIAARFRRGDWVRNAVGIFLVCVIAGVLFTMDSMRVYITPNYLTPFMPVLLLATVAMVERAGVCMMASLPLANVLTAGAMMAVAQPLYQDSVIQMQRFFDYRAEPEYAVYKYIQANIPAGASIAHDQHVAIPSGRDFKDLHFWRLTADELENAHPDYLIFDTFRTYNGNYQPQTLHLMKMTATESYRQVTTLNGRESSIQVWKKDR